MKPFNYIFIVVVIILLISSAIGMFFVGGYTSQTISLILAAMAVSLVINGIYGKFLSKEKKKMNETLLLKIKLKHRLLMLWE